MVAVSSSAFAPSPFGGLEIGEGKEAEWACRFE
jgi:hypothetical protein